MRRGACDAAKPLSSSEAGIRSTTQCDAHTLLSKSKPAAPCQQQLMFTSLFQLTLHPACRENMMYSQNALTVMQKSSAMHYDQCHETTEAWQLPAVGSCASIG
mmetsp:Transcript_18650/g.40068  ORF Transcript_18650/g.40068 Transcript_18650/m.40068 type:complete len:103 (+) Transcript_18650:226-534(+)